jgi:arginyl-tRNA synthetase
MKNEIQQIFQDVLTSLGVTDVTPEISWSEDSKHGEYTTNIAMRLASRLKKPPMDIALQVVESISRQLSAVSLKEGYQNSVQHNQKDTGESKKINILQAIDHVEAVAPGFINVFLSEATISTRLVEVLTYGNSAVEGLKSKEKIMVEYTDPNPLKELHIGHLYSNAVGESIARLFEATGRSVKRADYFGDVGMHVAKTLWGLERKFETDHTSLDTLAALPLEKRIHYIAQAYALGTSVFEGDAKDEKAIEEMKDINYYAYIAAQKRNKKESGKKPVIDYTAFVAKDKTDEAERIGKLYLTGYAWSMEYFTSIFKRLGTTFDYYYPESMVAEEGMALVSKHIGDVFEKSDGAIVYRGEKEGLHTRVFVNALGLPTYEAKELGLAPTKYADFPYDHSYIATGNEINEYFKVLMSALSKINPTLAAKNTHIGHGMVRNADGTKMSSRKGTALTGVGLLDAVKDEIRIILENSKSNYTKEEQETIAEAATIAAVKYSLLRVSLPSDIAFDMKSSVSFDGDSGPYLLYTYARCKSVLAKAPPSLKLRGAGGSLQGNNPPAGGQIPMNPEEKEIARLILHFPEVIQDAADHIAPSIICSYINDLAQAFNFFYAKHEIAHDSRRLTLTSAMATTLKNALHLLGIPTVERM